MCQEAAQHLALVEKALRSGLSNCVEWKNDKIEARVASDPANQGLTPEGIKRLVLDHVNAGGTVDQRVETRPEHCHRSYWYRVVVEADGFPHGLFVEMELSDDDPDYPEVSLVNAHPQRR